jgi:hypothetical protein
MKNHILSIVAMMMLFSSCSRDSELDRTIFVPDESNNNLPAYTEWGYNAFGAIYDIRNYFLVSNSIVPCKILYKDGLLHFSLNGILTSNYNNQHEKMTLLFSFPKENISQYYDLLALNNTEINLASNDCIVKINNGENEQVLDIIDGFLCFKRAQLLSIDDEPNRVILSGIFELRFLENGNDFPISFSEGRFDFGINNNVFYVY